jgi:hypothetical protein
MAPDDTGSDDTGSNDTATPRAHPPEDQRDEFTEAVSNRYPFFEELITR